MRYRTGKYTVSRRVHASFSPEVLQAGAVKGLTVNKSCTEISASHHHKTQNSGLNKKEEEDLVVRERDPA